MGKISIRIGDWGWRLLPILGSLAVTFGALLLGLDKWQDLRSWPGFVLAFGALATVVGSIVAGGKERRLSRLEAENRRLGQRLEDNQQDYYSMLERELEIVSTHVLNLGNSDRVSVYKHDGRAFVMLGRYSPSPVYRKKGRGAYPDDEGCIGTAWERGRAFVDQLPDPASSEDEYVEVLKTEWGIKKAVARAFRMKSRCYAAFGIPSANRSAVVVFESLEVGRFDSNDLQKKLDEGVSTRLTEFMSRMQQSEPSPSFARKEGF